MWSEEEVIMKGQGYIILFALKMEEREYQQLLEVGKGKEQDSPLETPKRNTALPNLDFSLM